jgi:uncharacterized membrane protein YjgN (DUF898 family)
MDAKIDAAPQAPAVRHQLRFEGLGGEYFKIWIVNLALTIVTLGIFSAWAKVRSKRYFYGNTYIGEHNFDYHGSPLRILVGRLIAAAILLAYGLSIAFLKWFVFVIGIALFFATPWLVNASLRFNARNSSYRNIRFDFTGTYADAFGVYFLWPLLVVVTLGTTIPLARRARVQYNINNHTFGGRYFDAQLPGRDMYMIYLAALGMMMGLVIVAMLVAAVGAGFSMAMGANLEKSAGATALGFVIGAAYCLGALLLMTFVGTRVLNLALNHTSLSTRYKFEATLSAAKMIGLVFGNFLLTLVTLGLYYPWAHVRTVKYLVSNIAVTGGADIEGFTSDLVLGQGAIGEEVASFFDVDVGF